MNETLTETVNEKLSENVPQMNENLGRDKGKRKLYERFLNESSSEFDDSSDEDYVQSNSETDSDTQSLVLEDVEAESDDDIFLNKNPSKRDLIKKLKRVMKDKNKTVMTEQMPETGDGDWASDIGDEEIWLVYQAAKKRDGMEKYSGSICPNVIKKINKQQSQARHCFTRWCGGSEFEVDHFLDKFVVDLEKKTCTCGMFQLTGLPCCHACAAIGSKRSKLEDYVDDCYTKSTYLKVYSEIIHAVPGAKDYITTSFEPFKPPHMKKKRGRPKKLRRKGPDELQSTSTRKGLTHTCSKCLKTGHNKESCKNPIHPKSKFFKESIPEEISQGSQAPPMSQEPAGESTNFISKQQKESGQQFASSTKSVV
ncbi:UNVERIFIED_CONTAM: hypothetical protein Scaly_1783300 [Sesamum calycinum]|uniref:SWIM-type domain-containing protein n=1 Tax=Sesamum calycinum TaxID=2727403 RepID=A0AAW2NWM6_9LAMI